MNDIPNRTRRAALAVLATAALGAIAAPAIAAENAKALVDAAKASGVVGEQGDGFLGLVSSTGDAALQAAVAEINAGRAEAYRDAAARTGVSPAAAGQATAVQLRERLPTGQYYRPLDGVWTRK